MFVSKEETAAPSCRGALFERATYDSFKEALKKTSKLDKCPTSTARSLLKQVTFADAEHAGKRKQTRRERFWIEMDQVVPWNS